jgi:hypothetical protein
MRRATLYETTMFEMQKAKMDNAGGVAAKQQKRVT